MLSTPAALAALVALALRPVAAHAQTTPSGARADFVRGVAALDDGRYADAVAALESSYRLYPAPVALYDLGLAYRGLGRDLAAIDAFERYLAHPEPDATASDLATVRFALARLRSAVAVLQLDVAPSAAALHLDGRVVPMRAGVLPIDPGTHVLEASAPGYRETRRELRVSPGEQRHVTLRLERTGLAPWVVPATIAGAVLVAAGAVITVLALATSTLPPLEPSLGNAQEIRAH